MLNTYVRKTSVHSFVIQFVMVPCLLGCNPSHRAHYTRISRKCITLERLGIACCDYIDELFIPPMSFLNWVHDHHAPKKLLAESKAMSKVFSLLWTGADSNGCSVLGSCITSATTQVQTILLLKIPSHKIIFAQVLLQNRNIQVIVELTDDELLVFFHCYNSNLVGDVGSQGTAVLKSDFLHSDVSLGIISILYVCCFIRLTNVLTSSGPQHTLVLMCKEAWVCENIQVTRSQYPCIFFFVTRENTCISTSKFTLVTSRTRRICATCPDGANIWSHPYRKKHAVLGKVILWFSALLNKVGSCQKYIILGLCLTPCLETKIWVMSCSVQIVMHGHSWIYRQTLESYKDVLDFSMVCSISAKQGYVQKTLTESNISQVNSSSLHIFSMFKQARRISLVVNYISALACSVGRHYEVLVTLEYTILGVIEVRIQVRLELASHLHTIILVEIVLQCTICFDPGIAYLIVGSALADELFPSSLYVTGPLCMGPLAEVHIEVAPTIILFELSHPRRRSSLRETESSASSYGFDMNVFFSMKIVPNFNSRSSTMEEGIYELVAGVWWQILDIRFGVLGVNQVGSISPLTSYSFYWKSINCYKVFAAGYSEDNYIGAPAVSFHVYFSLRVSTRMASLIQQSLLHFVVAKLGSGACFLLLYIDHYHGVEILDVSDRYYLYTVMFDTGIRGNMLCRLPVNFEVHLVEYGRIESQGHNSDNISQVVFFSTRGMTAAIAVGWECYNSKPVTTHLYGGVLKTSTSGACIFPVNHQPVITWCKRKSFFKAYSKSTAQSLTGSYLPLQQAQPLVSSIQWCYTTSHYWKLSAHLQGSSTSVQGQEPTTSGLYCSSLVVQDNHSIQGLLVQGTTEEPPTTSWCETKSILKAYCPRYLNQPFCLKAYCPRYLNQPLCLKWPLYQNSSVSLSHCQRPPPHNPNSSQRTVSLCQTVSLSPLTKTLAASVPALFTPHTATSTYHLSNHKSTTTVKVQHQSTARQHKSSSFIMTQLSYCSYLLPTTHHPIQSSHSPTHHQVTSLQSLQRFAVLCQGPYFYQNNTMGHGVF